MIPEPEVKSGEEWDERVKVTEAYMASSLLCTTRAQSFRESPEDPCRIPSKEWEDWAFIHQIPLIQDAVGTITS